MSTNEPKEKRFFWLDEWDGKAKGGYFIRNKLFQFLERLEKRGMKPVAIVYDGTWNLEIIVEEKRGPEGDD